MDGPIKSFEFGCFRLEPAERRLLCDGRPISLTPKAFQTLVFLVENCGHVVSKDELIKNVWPETFVEEGGLARNISVLRKVLGDGPSGQTFIETVPKRGYRFVAQVRELDPHARTPDPANQKRIDELRLAGGDGAMPEAVSTIGRRFFGHRLAIVVLVAAVPVSAFWGYKSAWVATPAMSPQSVAVLPFHNWDAGNDSDYIGLGIADAVIIRLSYIGRISVRPTSTITRYMNRPSEPLAVGRELAVDALVDGRIQRAGDRIRVTVQLFDTRSGTISWAGTFDEHFQDIFSVEDAISQRIAEVLLTSLTAKEKRRLVRHETENIEAYQAYLNGRYRSSQRTPSALLDAVTHFHQASTTDPGFALAFSGLADCYALLGVYHALQTSEAFPKAKVAAARALAIDDSLAEAHTTLAFVKTHYEWDWSGGAAEYRRAIELNPSYATAHHWYAINLMSTGRSDESIRQILRAQELDPLSPIISTDVAEMFYWAGQNDRAVAQARKTLELHPHYPMAHGLLGWAYAQNGQFREALSEFRKAQATSDDPASRLGLGYVSALAGNTDDARRILLELKDLSTTKYVSPHHFAVMYAALGERDDAFDWLERAYEDRVVQLNWLKIDPRFRNLRADPRFKDLLRRLSLDP